MDRKVVAGGRLRALRRSQGETQAEMARRLQISASYVNLLERNQRSLSLPLLIRVCEAYEVAPETFSEAQELKDFAALRQVFEDPLFAETPVDAVELRQVAEAGSDLSVAIRRLHAAYRTAMDRLQAVARQADAESTNPEEAIYGFLRARDNHVPVLEAAAREINDDPPSGAERLYARLTDLAEREFDLRVAVRPVTEMRTTFRYFDRHRRRIALSQALDFSNRLFQLAHQICLLRHDELLNRLLEDGGITRETARARGRLELANYFAAAVLMPYRPFLRHAQETGYDVDALGHRFGVTFEMAATRLTTLASGRERGIPFFLVRIDQAGNVVKRAGGTPVQFARHGGACPRWRLHDAFVMPDRILTQVVELPDRSRYFTVMRTVHRPRLDHRHEPRRLAVALGCELDHADETVYFAKRPEAPVVPTPIGINCGLCPRAHCDHRANPPLHMDLPLDEDRRGQTRFES